MSYEEKGVWAYLISSACASVAYLAIVVPRLGRFGEAVDDHQVPFARRLSDRGLVTVVDDPSLLPSAIDDAHAPVELESTGRLGLAQDLATYLRTLVDGAEPGVPGA